MEKTENKVIDLQKQAQEIIEIAQKFGVEQNFFFVTTFKRYQVQMNILIRLEKDIVNSEALVTKEYVKGRENKYVNPAITEYNRTATSANQTVLALMKIIRTMRDDPDADSNPLLDFLARRKK